MKTREADRVEGVILPRKTVNRFTKSEIEFMLTLAAKGYRAKAIASMISEKFGVKRMTNAIYMKLRSMGKNGVPTFKECEVETTYEVPETASQMLKQLELGFTLLDNARKFIEGVKNWEMAYLEQSSKMKKIEGMINNESIN